MYHATDGYLAATNELMSLHVALETRRGATMASGVLARLAEVQAAHGTLTRPPQVGRVIGLTARPTTR
jgi:acyl-CoA thioester hydrolase